MSKIVLLRFLKRCYQDGRYNLINFGVLSMTDAEINWATPVVWVKT